MVQGGLTRGISVCLCAAVLLLGAAASLAATDTARASVYFGATISGETYGGTGNAPDNLSAWETWASSTRARWKPPSPAGRSRW